jgi:hypothetical protein
MSTKGAATYFGLLAMLRQNELLDEAAQLRRARQERSHRRGRAFTLSILHRRRGR